MDNREALRQLIQEKYIHKGHFTLSSGKTSSRYFDIKAMMGHSLDSGLLIHELADKIKELNIEIGSIGGIELGGALIASALPYCKRTCFIRKAKRDHGMNKEIEGIPLAPILLLDDVFSSGQTLFDTYGTVQLSAGFKIAGFLCVINRFIDEEERGSKLENLERFLNIKVHSLFREGDFE